MVIGALRGPNSDSGWIMVACVTGVILGCGVGLLLSIESQRNLLLNVVPAVVLTAGAAAIRLDEGSWMSPGAFFALTWTILVWGSLILAPNVLVWHAALWLIVIACAAVYVGSVVGRAAPRHRHAEISLERPAEWPLLRTLVIVATFAGLGGVLVLLRAKGGGLGTLISGLELGNLARSYSVDRYSYGLREPDLAVVLSIGAYLAAFLGGSFLALPNVRIRWIGLLPLLPAIGQAAVLTTKASVLVVLTIMASSYLATHLALSGESKTRLLSRRLVWVTILIPPIFALVVWTQFSRYQYSIDNPNQVLEILRNLQVSTLGFLGALSAWLQSGDWAATHHTWGTLTFAGPFSNLGVTRTAGLYSTSVLPDPSANVPSNIYTVFRGLIEDFSPLGAALFLATAGVVAGWAYRSVRAGRTAMLSLLVAFYAFAIFSPFVNIFSFTTILAAWIMFATYIWLSRSRLPQ